MTPNADFKARLTSRELLLGVFMKTPHPVVAEVLGRSGLDVLILDAEHAPFDRAGIDLCVMAARSVNCPLLVRVPNAAPDTILGVLDSGAAGIVVPHVKSAEQAAEVVRNTRYGAGQGRGFAATTRAGGYGQRSAAEHLAASETEISVICQIEDPEGFERRDAIAAVDGVDAVFVGRADLAISYGLEAFQAPEVAEKCALTLGVARSASGLFCALGEDLAPWRKAGASLFIVGSDHALMAEGVREMRKGWRGA